MQRIGVFVCHCGTNIAATVDVKKVVDVISKEPGVVHAEDYQYMCSETGQQKVIDAIQNEHLTGVVICSCSPRMHEGTFRKAAEKAGLNPYQLEIANIREQCSWIHKDMEEATEKAVILARAAVAKVMLDTPLTPGESRVVKRALVIGGGIAGIQTALDIADAGYEVDIVEKTPSIGGRMSQLDKTFPTLDCSSCILTPRMGEVNAHEKINIYTYSEVESVGGFVGDFKVDIRKKARYVDMDKCTGCGLCQEKCPSKKNLSEFNRGLSNRTAIYTPFAQAVPNVPVIDTANCIHFKTGKCGICSKVCAAGAVNYDQKDEVITREYGAIVVATGFDTISLDKFDEYYYNQSKKTGGPFPGSSSRGNGRTGFSQFFSRITGQFLHTACIKLQTAFCVTYLSITFFCNYANIFSLIFFSGFFCNFLGRNILFKGTPNVKPWFLQLTQDLYHP